MTEATGGAYFVEDEVSFTRPRREAIAACVAQFKQASLRVKGAEARLSAALADLKDIDAFGQQMARLIEERGFHKLPEMKRGRARLEGFRHLTIGPWRGVFLVAPEGRDVVALLFSRHPHDLASRMMEIAAAYLAKPQAPESGS